MQPYDLLVKPSFVTVPVSPQNVFLPIQQMSKRNCRLVAGSKICLEMDIASILTTVNGTESFICLTLCLFEKQCQ